MESRTILIVDDEPQLRNLLRISLELDNYKVLEASNGAEGVDAAATFIPDLILLDLGLPDRSGHDVLKHLREWYSRPIIILSVQSGPEDIVKALDSGANDYLVKPFRKEELAARIRASLRHSTMDRNTPAVKYENITIDFLSRTVKKNDVVVKLTSTEYTLLILFVQNESKVLTHQFLLKHAWGPENENDTQYLRVFVGNLRKKLEDDPNRPRHILTESGVGYRFVGNYY
jgi:two-component system KDP operon response regulator KdpE